MPAQSVIVRVVCLLASLCLLAGPTWGQERPNILLIYADDHAERAIGAYGGLIDTPNIDRLAREGVRFTNSFVTNSICAPARASVLTGVHSCVNGLRTNADTFDGSQQTFPKLLQGAGYETAVIGKWHVKSDPTGFDSWEVLIDQGPYYNPPMKSPEGVRRFEGYTTDIITDKALEWLRNGRDPDKPFLLMCQHKAPHRNWQPAGRHLHLFDEREFPEPATLFDDYSGRASGAANQEMTIARHFFPSDVKLEAPGGLTDEQLAAWNAAYGPKNEAMLAQHLEGDDLTRWRYQRYIKDYLRCIVALDENVGRILDWLDESGLTDNTIVIYSSDQGFYLGEHGWYDKRWIYEQSLRTPMIVRWPGRTPPGTTCDAMVQNIDLAPTFLEVAGVAAPEPMHGQSLAAWLTGGTPGEWRNSIYYHYYENPGVHNVPRHVGVRTSRYKLAYYEQLNAWELFDLQRDPDEMRSVFDDRAYANVRHQLYAELERLMQRFGDNDVALPALPPPAKPVGGDDEGADTSYDSDWDARPDGPWLGLEVWANRLQDWRLRGGRVECTTSGERTPARTAVLLTRSIELTGDDATISVRTGPVDADAGANPSAFAGLLIGAGGAGIDYRITALTHHRPAADGGMLVVVDHSGRVALRDFSGGGGGGLWSLGGTLGDKDIPVLAPGSDPTRPVDPRVGVELRVRITRDVVGFIVEAESLDPGTGERISGVRVEGVEGELVEGLVALVSHLGREGSRAGHWFDALHLEGGMVDLHLDRAFGPIFHAMYTMQGHTLRLTAQMPPLGELDTRTARLQTIDDEGRWIEVASTTIVPDSWTATFEVGAWDNTRNTVYRVVYDIARTDGKRQTYVYGGIVRAEPAMMSEMRVASLNCQKTFTGDLAWNQSSIWFPHGEVATHAGSLDPDLVFFAGDQIYEGDLTPAQRQPEDEAVLDYLYKWYRFCWSFGSLTRNRPTVCIPDDHDVYHGNIWGAGGVRARSRDGLTAQDSGGYVMSPRFVNAVHRTQTSHLPPPVVDSPVGDGISAYTTRLDWGGVSFAILADRMFKSAPAPLLPEGRIINGWSQNPDWDPATRSDDPEAQLLGAQQEAFLRDWAVDFSNNIWAKVVLSQSPLANIATIPGDATSGGVIPSIPVADRGEAVEGFKQAADFDSNGWPSHARDEAIRSMRRGFALHLAGDQHLGTLIQYGLDGWRDAGWCFTSPAIANTWPRRWHPPEPGANPERGAPEYTGDFTDGFGNKMTVWAAANPFRTGVAPERLNNYAPGFGVVRLSRPTRQITYECWPRWIDPTSAGAEQYEGWPRTTSLASNYAPRGAQLLATLDVPGMSEPVVQLIDGTGEIVYAMRWHRSRVALWAPPGAGRYSVRVGEPGTERWTTIEGLEAGALAKIIRVSF